MTTSTAVTAQGTTFEIETATPDSFVAIGNCKTFQWSPGQRTESDTSHLTSTAKEFLLGLKDNGTISVTVDRNESDAGQLRCRTIAGDTTTNALKITLSDASILTAEVFVSSFDLSGGADAPYSGTLNFRISGEPVWS